MDDDTTLRIELRFKNARLYNAIVADALPVLGETARVRTLQAHGPIKPWCDFHGFSCTYVYDLLNLKRSPLRRLRGNNQDGHYAYVLAWGDMALRISALLNVEPDWLFPDELYRRQWPMVALVGNESGMRLAASADRPLALGERRAVLLEVLATLGPKERQVLTQRFGLAGDDEMPLAAIGHTMGVTRERVRQIEAKAMRKLRHPQRSRRLKPLLEV